MGSKEFETPYCAWAPENLKHPTVHGPWLSLIHYELTIRKHSLVGPTVLNWGNRYKHTLLKDTAPMGKWFLSGFSPIYQK